MATAGNNIGCPLSTAEAITVLYPNLKLATADFGHAHRWVVCRESHQQSVWTGTNPGAVDEANVPRTVGRGCGSLAQITRTIPIAGVGVRSY